MHFVDNVGSCAEVFHLRIVLLCAVPFLKNSSLGIVTDGEHYTLLED